MRYEIEKGFEMVDISKYVFRDNNGLKCKIGGNCKLYGFVKNGKFVAKTCKSAGGSTLPMVYPKKIAKQLIESGFVKEEIAWCEAV